MSDLFDRVLKDQDIFKKLLGKIPGFDGYIERNNRRMADKLVREQIANEYEELWQRLSGLQVDLINQGELKYVDDVESAAIKLRQFIDRVRTAAYGYTGFFDAVKIKEADLERVYKYDLALFDLAEEVSRGIDNIEQSIGTDGLPAAIRNVVSLAKKCVKAFDKRSEVMMGPTDIGTEAV
jgi:hypothetical protein